MVERHVKALERIGRSCSNGFVSLCTCTTTSVIDFMQCRLVDIEQIFLMQILITLLCSIAHAHIPHSCDPCVVPLTASLQFLCDVCDLCPLLAVCMSRVAEEPHYTQPMCSIVRVCRYEISVATHGNLIMHSMHV